MGEVIWNTLFTISSNIFKTKCHCKGYDFNSKSLNFKFQKQDDVYKCYNKISTTKTNTGISVAKTSLIYS